jgi:hypothetical protein
VKSPGESERHCTSIVGREKEHRLLEGSQASPTRPSDKSRVKVNALGWLEAVA